MTMLTSKNESILASLDKENRDQLTKTLEDVYNNALEVLNDTDPKDNLWNDLQSIYLETIDRYWVDHLDNLNHLREGITIRGYGQEDPYRLYSFDALHLFNEMLNSFFRDIIRYFLQVNATKDAE